MNDKFAKCATIDANRSEQDLSSDAGRTSRGNDLFGSLLISLSTSADVHVALSKLTSGWPQKSLLTAG